MFVCRIKLELYHSGAANTTPTVGLMGGVGGGWGVRKNILRIVIIHNHILSYKKGRVKVIIIIAFSS